MKNLLHTPFVSWRQHPAALALGVAGIVDAVAPKSALGRSRLEGHRPFHPGRTSEAQQHFRDMAGVRDAFAHSPDLAAAASEILEHLPDIRDIIPSLPDIDFTALARLCQFSKGCDGLARRMPRSDVFASLKSAAVALGPLLQDMQRVNAADRGFRLGDSASKYLAGLRQELAGLVGDITDARQQHIATVRSELGLPPGLGSVVVSIGDPLEVRIRAHSATRCVNEDATSAMFAVPDPASVEDMEARRQELLEAERKEQRIICRDLGKKAAAQQDALLQCADAAGYLDFLLALLNAGGECLPVFGDDITVVIDQGSLPALRRQCEKNKETYQPLDITLPAGMTVLRGANMSGKTVALKTLGWLVALAHAGLPLPVQSATMPLLDNLWVFEPDAGDMQQGLSAFGREVAFWRDISETLQQRSDMTALLLADEPMRTTNNEEGRALLLALLGSLGRCDRIMGLLTTHIDGLQAAGVRLCHMAGLGDAGRDALLESSGLSAAGVRGMMEYRILSGDHRRGSDAIAVAALLGLDADIIEAARTNMKK